MLLNRLSNHVTIIIILKIHDSDNFCSKKFVCKIFTEILKFSIFGRL